MTKAPIVSCAAAFLATDHPHRPADYSFLEPMNDIIGMLLVHADDGRIVDAGPELAVQSAHGSAAELRHAAQGRLDAIGQAVNALD